MLCTCFFQEFFTCDYFFILFIRLPFCLGYVPLNGLGTILNYVYLVLVLTHVFQCLSYLIEEVYLITLYIV